MKTYRKRFVQLNLLMVGAVLLLSLIGLGVYLYHNARQELQRTMEAVVSPLNGVQTLRMDDGDDWDRYAPDGALPEEPENIELPETDEDRPVPPDGQQPWQGREDGGQRSQADAQALQGEDARRSINTIFCDSRNGQMQLLGETALIDESRLAEIVEKVNAQQSDFGELRDEGLFYYRSIRGDRIAIASNGYLWDAVKGTYLILGLVFLAAMALFWLISRRISRLAVRPLEEAMQREKQFVADASHDLKTPLTIVLANLGILREHPNATVGEQEKWIDSTEQAAQRMQGLVNEMLTLSQAESVQRSRPKQPVDLSSVLTRAALQLESLAFEREVTLETEIPENVTVSGWPEDLSRVAEDLMENAMKYEPAGGSIRVRLETQRHHTVLSVQNLGSVISAEDLPHVFERFYRADKTRSSQGGHGLGLAIVKQMCEAMGGSVEAESAPETGTVFRVKLPLAKNS